MGKISNKSMKRSESHYTTLGFHVAIPNFHFFLTFSFLFFFRNICFQPYIPLSILHTTIFRKLVVEVVAVVVAGEGGGGSSFLYLPPMAHLKHFLLKKNFFITTSYYYTLPLYTYKSYPWQE